MTRPDQGPDRLFMRSDQMELLDRSVEQEVIERTAGQEADDARRAEYTERLRAMLPELRKVEGFPIGSDEDILALSDPPYYTACPNPFLAEFVAEHGTPYDEATDDYHREPFAADVSEGKNDPIYNAHSYHTKVPHKAVAQYVAHYTDGGAVILDGFCGSGMTGVGAHWVGDSPPSGREGAARRSVVLNDLSPAATLIARTYAAQVDSRAFALAADNVLRQARAEIGWMYETQHADGRPAEIEYVVWSQVFACPHCSVDVLFAAEAIDQVERKVRDRFPCPACGSILDKDHMNLVFSSTIDKATGFPWKRITIRPYSLSYLIDGQRHERRLTPQDARTLDRIDALPLPSEVPTDRLPIDTMYHGSRLAPKGVTRVHHFYVSRAAQALATLWRLAATYPSMDLRPPLLFWVEQAVVGMTILNRHHVVGRANVNQQLNGVYYIPSVQEETSPFRILEGKATRLTEVFGILARSGGWTAISTGDCARLLVPDNSVDYIFTDPPFGENIYYADLNFLVEAWHHIRTNARREAIVDKPKGKKLVDYQHLMEDCFRTYARVLKPGRWMTVVFHNSSNAVWNAIQEAIQRAGFVVADVRVLDKKQGSYRQLTSTAVKQDLVISAYKPRAGFERGFSLEAGSEQGAWDFVRQHLEQLPVFVEHGGRVEVIAERQNYLLYDRMVAFHIQRGATVPLSAGAFYQELRQRFVERDDMYFTPLQAAEYDRRRLEATEVEQLSVFVVDERSAIQWLRGELGARPQTLQDLTPRFLRELSQSRFEALPELRDILGQNFVEDPVTRRWRVPDPGNEADLEALRRRALLSEFAAYAQGTAKLKRFRLEAIRAGISDLWERRDYRAIIRLCDRLPDEVVREDPALLMYYDNAVTREGAG